MKKEDFEIIDTNEKDIEVNDADKVKGVNNVAMGISLGMCFGMCFGMSFGVAFDNIPIGMCIGVALGMSLGAMQGLAKDKKGDNAEDKE